jgi:MerR family transcriptional regulator/heat shock protein HspR
MTESRDLDAPRYTISVVARLVNLHPQTLRNYEDNALVVPSRSPGNIRLYTDRDVQRLHKIVRMTTELGINLAGVEVILNLTERVEHLQAEVEDLQARLEALDSDQAESESAGRTGRTPPDGTSAGSDG